MINHMQQEAGPRPEACKIVKTSRQTLSENTRTLANVRSQTEIARTETNMKFNDSKSGGYVSVMYVKLSILGQLLTT